MKVYEIGTGYTPIPAQMGAATEIVVEELTKAFIKQGISVEIIDIATKDRKTNALPIREVKVPTYFAGTDVKLGIMHKLKRVVYSIALAEKLKKILRASNEKVVLHFHNQYNLFFFLKLTSPALRCKCKIAYTNHSGIWRLPWEQIENTIKKRYFQEAECMKCADYVFVLNHETKQTVIEQLNVSEEKIIVIGNGVNTEIYSPLTAQDKETLYKKWDVCGKKVILQVGSVYENKGQLRSIQYLEPLMKEYPDLLYMYAGGIVDEEYQQQLVNYTQEHGLQEQVRYVGMVAPGQTLNELYNIAQATILASQYESFGLVVIESLATGTPVFIDKNAAFEFEKGCIFFERESLPDVVKSEILNVSESTFEKLCTLARCEAQKQFSWEKIAQDYCEAWSD